jgi:hypothetical protein
MFGKIMAMAFIMSLMAFMYANVLEAQVTENGLVLVFFPIILENDNLYLTSQIAYFSTEVFLPFLPLM